MCVVIAGIIKVAMSQVSPFEAEGYAALAPKTRNNYPSDGLDLQVDSRGYCVGTAEELMRYVTQLAESPNNEAMLISHEEGGAVVIH